MMNNTESQQELNARFADALVPLTVTFGVYTVVGVIGNTFVLLVFIFGKKYTNKSTFRVFVICMGIIDLLTSAFLIPAEMINHRHYFNFSSAILCKGKHLVNFWQCIASALTLLVICVDRFMKVVMPLKKQISPRLAVRLCIVFSITIPLILSVPGAIIWGVLPCNKTNIYNTTTEVSICDIEPRYKKSIGRYIYRILLFVLMIGITIVCPIMYILIGRQVYKHWGSIPGKYRKNSTNSWKMSLSTTSAGQRNSDNQSGHRKDSDVSSNIRPALVKQESREGERRPSTNKKMSLQSTTGFGARQFPYKALIWFVLTMVFIVTYLVAFLLGIYSKATAPKNIDTVLVFHLVYRLHFINNIINPIVYALLEKKFREACIDIVPTIKVWCTRN